MTNPEKEFFDFLTTEENLKGLIIAKNQFPSVKEKLIQDFWNLVASNIRSGLSDKPEWEIVLEPNITKWFSKLYIKEKRAHIYPTNHLPSFLYCWQRLNQHYPYYGFWINEQTTEFDINKVSEYYRSIHNEEFHEFHGYEDWFIVWDGVESFDLSNDETLFQIIPSVMHEKAKDFADILLNLFEKNLVHYEYIKNNFRI